MSPLSASAFLHKVVRFVGVPSVLAVLILAIGGVRSAYSQSFALYVSDYQDNAVEKVDSFGNVTPFAAGLNGPSGIAIDSSGNLYVANYGGTENGDVIDRITPNGTVSIFASGSNLRGIQGLAIGSDGSIYAASDVLDEVIRVAQNGSSSVVASSLNTP